MLFYNRVTGILSCELKCIILCFAAGAENLLNQQTVTFRKKAGCRCPRLIEGNSYYIMGRDGLPHENEAGQKKYVVVTLASITTPRWP